MLQKYKNANKLLQTDRLVLNAFPQTEWKDDISFVYNQDFFENGEKKSRKVKYDCVLKTKTILEEEDKKSDEKNELNISPDGKNALYIDNHNLFFKDTKTGKVTQITFDGEDGFEYAIESGCNNSFVGTAIKVGKEPPFALWSPNSRKILTYKVDQRNVEKFHIIRNVMPDEENPRPQLYSYAYHLPNDENVPLIYLYVYDLDTKELKKLDTEPIYFNFNSPLDNYSKKAKWLDNDYIYFVRLNRYFNNAKFNILDVQQNVCQTIVEEKSDTFLFYDTFGGADGGDDFNFSAYVFKDRSYAIWKSEENDFAQFLLCNVNNGERKAITSLEYNPMNIVKVDEENSCLYFTANNINISSDPYFIYLCKINLDGSGFSILTPEDASHSAKMSPDCKAFTDTHSRVDLPPVTVVRDTNGALIDTLEVADISKLLEAGFIMPERIKVKASDGKTDLYGILIKPADFDENKKYPLIDYIYGGVQCTNVPKTFVWHIKGKVICGGLQSLAQLGFVGLVLDGPGTPHRGKSFHNICYKNLQGSAGLDEHYYCTKQLAKQYSFIDIDKVGIWGASGGGYATFRAMCLYPDLYKAGASFSGNHDERLYNACWVERYNGEYDEQVYKNQDNATLAKNLQGRLLIAHGDLDDNVHISNTMRVVAELIKYNKDFEMLIVPNEYHNLSANSNYAIRKRWDLFTKYLLGVEPPKEYKIESYEYK